jgi:uncharacterized protein (TIGR03118 family)
MTHIKVKELVSNLPHEAEYQDVLLVNPWGAVIHNDSIWAANNGSGTLTNYDLNGRKLAPGTVTLPMGGATGAVAPTGMVVNHTRGFVIEESVNNKAASMLLVASENGVIYGYNPLVDPDNAYIGVDNSLLVNHPVYKGLAIVGNNIFATDFYNNKIDVFDFNFAPVVTSATVFPFIDTSDVPVPVGFAPFNIVHMFGKLFVTYAQQLAPANVDDQAGEGNGYINIFDLDGKFVKRFASIKHFNSPWGLAVNPKDNDEIIVGNNGNGRIGVFNLHGEYKGAFRNKHGKHLIVDGLWSLVKDESELYYTAGPALEVDGIVGKVKYD